MARVKKPDMPPPPPKHPRECKHGCTDCKYLSLDVKAFPCRDCERWNYWEDAHPEKTNTVPLPSQPVPSVSVQENTAPVSEPKKRGRRAKTQLVFLVDTPQSTPEQIAPAPKKRGRKPKTAVIIPSTPENTLEHSIPEPVKQFRIRKKASDDEPASLSPGKDQFSLF